jgi:hypothetical protein
MLQAISSQSIHLAGHGTYTHKDSLITKFFTWCNKQEERRFMWLSVALLIGIGTVLPLTLFAIMVGANSNFTLWVIASIVNVPILVVNLALQSTKATLPVLFVAWAIDALIIVYCAVLFFQNL